MNYQKETKGRLLQAQAPYHTSFDGQKPVLRKEYSSGVFQQEMILSGNILPASNNYCLRDF